MPKFKPPKFVSRRNFLKILRRYDCEFDPERGRGNHTMIMRNLDHGTHCFSLPFRRTYGHDYINPLRRKLHLTPGDGVTDREFYGKGKRGK